LCLAPECGAWTPDELMTCCGGVATCDIQGAADHLESLLKAAGDTPRWFPHNRQQDGSPDWTLLHILAECYSKLHDRPKHQALLWQIYREAGKQDGARAGINLGRHYYAHGKPAPALLLLDASVATLRGGCFDHGRRDHGCPIIGTNGDRVIMEAEYSLGLGLDLAIAAVRQCFPVPPCEIPHTIRMAQSTGGHRGTLGCCYRACRSPTCPVSRQTCSSIRLREVWPLLCRIRPDNS
jgi:hypothetical protein